MSRWQTVSDREAHRHNDIAVSMFLTTPLFYALMAVVLHSVDGWFAFPAAVLLTLVWGGVAIALMFHWDRTDFTSDPAEYDRRMGKQEHGATG